MYRHCLLISFSDCKTGKLLTLQILEITEQTFHSNLDLVENNFMKVSCCYDAETDSGETDSLETCGQVVHLHGVANDRAASISGRSVPVQVDGVRHAAPRSLVALQVGQAHDGFAGLPGDVVQGAVPVISHLTATSPPGGTVAILQVRTVSGQGLQLLLLLRGGVPHGGGGGGGGGGHSITRLDIREITTTRTMITSCAVREHLEYWHSQLYTRVLSKF